MVCQKWATAMLAARTKLMQRRRVSRGNRTCACPPTISPPCRRPHQACLEAVACPVGALSIFVSGVRLPNSSHSFAGCLSKVVSRRIGPLVAQIATQDASGARRPPFLNTRQGCYPRPNTKTKQERADSQSDGSRLRITFGPFPDFASLLALLLSGLPRIQGPKMMQRWLPGQNLGRPRALPGTSVTRGTGFTRQRGHPPPAPPDTRHRTPPPDTAGERRRRPGSLRGPPNAGTSGTGRSACARCPAPTCPVRRAPPAAARSAAARRSPRRARCRPRG
jgi:hypothetical protein